MPTRAQDNSWEIVRYSARIQLPIESKNSPRNKILHDKLLITEILFLREYLLLDLCCDRSSRAYRRAIRSLKNVDAKAYFVDMKELRTFSVSPEFRALVGRNPDLAFKQLRRKVHYVWTVTSFPEIWKPENPLKSYKNWLQWVSFDSRCNLVSADYSDELWTEYLCDEWEMSQWEYDPKLILSLNRIIKEWCEYYTPNFDFHGLPPSGATRELRRSENCPITTLGLMFETEQTERYLNFFYGNDTNRKWVVPQPYRIAEMQPMRLEFVPKSPLTNRMISIDSTTMVFFQKDLDYKLRRWLSSLPVPCDLTDQDRSRHMALKGSRSGNLDTFDIVKCSDSVTANLVHGIYNGTVWHDPLFYTRNKRVQFRGYAPIALNKFAPMGSSTCFPVETSVLLACCELAIRRVKGRRGKRNDYRVYGDDTVIRHDCSEALREILSGIHLSIGEAKSFTDHTDLCFREACGLEALNGVDITPVRISRFQPSCVYTCKNVLTRKGFPRNLPDNPGAVVSIVDFTNRLLLAGLSSTRSFMMKLFSGREWFYHINRVDQTDFLAAMATNRPGLNGIQFPTPTFIVPDGTATNVYQNFKRGSSYTKDSEFQPVQRMSLVVKPKTPDKERVLEKLSEFGSTATPDDLSYHYWSLQKQRDSDRHCEAGVDGLVECLNYFGNGLTDGAASPASLSERAATTPLVWDWKGQYPV